MAREALGAAAQEVASADRRLAGWYSVHLGHTYELDGDPESASKQYADARSRTFFDIALPHPTTSSSVASAIKPFNSLHASLLSIFGNDRVVASNPWSRIDFHIKKICDASLSANQHEEAIRHLGEVLGFKSSRPEQESDQDSTLDVLWLHEEAKVAILWSLKSKKKPESLLNTEEVGTGHIHLQWFAASYPEYSRHELWFLAPRAEVVAEAHPSDKMKVVSLEDVQSLYRVLDQSMINLFRMPPAARVAEMEAMSRRLEWQPDGIRAQLRPSSIKRN